MHHAAPRDDGPQLPAPGLPPRLRSALLRLAGLPRLLVASDYDGVLAPIVTDPARAFPLPAAMTALAGLAVLPTTTVALVSGRALVDLTRLAQPPAQMRLVGSHGSEFTGEVTLSPAQQSLRARLVSTLTTLIRDYPGVRLETKPTSVVVHTRTARAEVAEAVQAAVAAGPAGWPGVHPTAGKEVVELAVVNVHKGTAVTALREQAGADAVLFLGDDVTDENAFRVLRGQDVGIKVGPGETLARFRVPDPPAAARVLALLLRLRTRPHLTPTLPSAPPPAPSI